MARPKLKIDPEQVYKLASIGCTNGEMASFFNCSKDTLENRFSAEIAKGRDGGKTRLRRLMWQSCDKGNVVMQIWLSKNLLGYSDKIEHDAQIKHIAEKAKEYEGMSKEELLVLANKELKRLKED